VPELARTDAACRILRNFNGQPHGPWHSIGDSAFFGMELDVGGGFFPFVEAERAGKNQPERDRQNWKNRYRLFHTEVPTFSTPFAGSEITAVEHPDEVAYCRCRLRTDLLAARIDRGIYVEVEIRANIDNLSLAVVDFEGGGRSSVTFSPETGAVLRERKVRESPRAIEGTYIHLLPPAPPGRRFEGVMGLYLRNSQLAFFRRWSAVPQDSPVMEAGGDSDLSAQPAAREAAEAHWETTGFCTDLRWAQGHRLSLCVAFRDDGEYHVRISRICRAPPVLPHISEAGYQDQQWHHLYGDEDHPLAI
jgi:hypothetical protein